MRVAAAAGAGATDALHPLWARLRCDNGREVFVNTFTGRVSEQRFAAKGPASIRGGILCDEVRRGGGGGGGGGGGVEGEGGVCCAMK